MLLPIALSTQEEIEFYQMVYESCYWKDDLRSYATELRNISTCTTLDDEYRDYRLEKALLLSAFTVRLLLEANKLSDSFGSRNLQVDYYSAKRGAQESISPLNKRFIDERYFDLDKSTSSSISIRQLTNQLIHSAVVLMFSYDATNRVIGFFVASDKDYEKRLCYCSLKEWISVVEAVADDDIVYALIYKDPKTGKYITVKLAASDLKDSDAVLKYLEAKDLAPETLDVIRKELAFMVTEKSALPESAAELNDATSESPDA